MRTPEELARELSLLSSEIGASFADVAALLTAWRKEIEDEAYNRGYNNGYARQKHDADWAKVEANL